MTFPILDAAAPKPAPPVPRPRSAARAVAPPEYPSVLLILMVMAICLILMYSILGVFAALNDRSPSNDWESGACAAFVLIALGFLAVVRAIGDASRKIIAAIEARPAATTDYATVHEATTAAIAAAQRRAKAVVK